jgi:DNA-binding response OmpR family regulator
MHILLVDDDSFLRDMYATKFSEFGHTVGSAPSGDTGLKLLLTEDFDVVLLDMVMPGMNGLDFLKAAFAQKKETSKTKFIVLSNQSEESDKAAALKAGAIGYIVKAESIPSDVVKKVEELFKS